MPVLHDSTGSIGLPEAAIRLSRFGLSYSTVWSALLAGRLAGHRHGRFWRVESTSLDNLERELARERATAAAAR